jgi:hypothetical protein
MANCISQFLTPLQTAPVLTVHDEVSPHFVLDVEVQLDKGTTDHDSRAQVIRKIDQPTKVPPDGLLQGKFDGAGSAPKCTFKKVLCSGDVHLTNERDVHRTNEEVQEFKLVVWYQCDGVNWSCDEIVFIHN